MLFNSKLQNGRRNISTIPDSPPSILAEKIGRRTHREGFLSQSRYTPSENTNAFETTKKLLDSTKSDSDAIAKLKHAYTTVLSEYEDAIARASAAHSQFIKRTNSSNPYLNSLLQFSTKDTCYVTALGIVRPIPTKTMLDRLIKLLGPPKVLTIPFLPSYLNVGAVIQTNPIMVAGPALTENETIGNEGAIVRVTKVLDIGAPTSTAKVEYLDCYAPKTQSGLTFIGNRPVQGVTDGGTYSHAGCKTAAVDSGFRYFGVHQINTTGDLTKGYCAVSNSLDPIVGGGVGTRVQSVIPVWTSQTASLGGWTAAVQPSGSIAVMDKSGKAIFSTKIKTSNLPSNYLGCYADSTTRQMPYDLGKSHTYETCMSKAAGLKYAYFGLQSRQPDGTSECWGSNDLAQASNLGQSQNCSADARGAMSGGGWTNAVYSHQSDAPFFIILEDDGDMKVYSGTGPADKQLLVWNSRTSAKVRDADPTFSAANGKGGKNWMAMGDVLSQTEFIGSPSGNIYLMMQSDGELALNTSVQVSNCSQIGNAMGGGVNATAVYKTTRVGIPANLHKSGYVDQMGVLHEGSSKLLSSTPIHDVDSIQYENYKKGSPLTDSSQFGISTMLGANAPTKQHLEQLKSKLDGISKNIIELTGKFSSSDKKMSAQTSENIGYLDKFVKEYDTNNKHVARADASVTNILNDSQIIINREHYMFSMWFLATVAAVGAISMIALP